MNQDLFWQLLNQSFEKNGGLYQDQVLISLLKKIEPSDILEFQKILMQLKDVAATGPLYAAGSLMNGSPCSDSTFDFFLNWLISRGSAVYRSAIENPDSLAALPMVGICEAWDEDVASAPYEAYQAKTGKIIFEYIDFDSLPARQEFEWSEFSSPQTLSGMYPKLWQIYGSRYDANA